MDRFFRLAATALYFCGVTFIAGAFAQSPRAAEAPPTSAYRGGAGSPASAQESNIAGTARRPGVAPRLPDPRAAVNTPEGLLAAAQRALDRGQTGAAQEALERAETRVLSRTTDPSMAGQPDLEAMVQHISAARLAIGAHDIVAAKTAIRMATASPVPATGPAVTISMPRAGVMDPMLGQPLMGAVPTAN